MPATKRTDASAKRFTSEERAAMQERAKELKTKQSKADDLADQLAKIAEMNPADREMAERFHALVTRIAPDLAPKTWYGMPAYYKDGKVLCFFQPAAKFKARYATFGFDENAKLDDGAMWPTSWALTKLTAAEETKIGELVKKAVG